MSDTAIFKEYLQAIDRVEVERAAREFFDEHDCPHAVNYPDIRNDPAHCIACLTDFACQLLASACRENASLTGLLHASRQEVIALKELVQKNGVHHHNCSLSLGFRRRGYYDRDMPCNCWLSLVLDPHKETP